LAEVLDRVLDKGIVIDAWAAVSLLGIEIVNIQAQVVVASVETYLKYANDISSLEVEQPKKGAVTIGADELIKYLAEHTGGIRLEQIVAYFNVPRERVEDAVSHLVDEHKVRRDPAHDLVLPTKG
jgi:hypothetical protein